MTETYQWQPNRRAGQTVGNRQIICPVTEYRFRKFIRHLLSDPSLTYGRWRAKYPEITHVSMVYVNGSKKPLLDGAGTLKSLRPRPKNRAWVRKVKRVG